MQVQELGEGLAAACRGGARCQPPATAAQLEAHQKSCGVRLSDELQQWLSLCDGAELNGGCLLGVHERKMAETIGQTLRQIRELAPGMLPTETTIPIGNDGCGSQYVIDPGLGGPLGRAVYFIDCDRFGRFEYTVASSVLHFVWFMLDDHLGDRRWPFDRGYVLEHDPGLREWSAPPPLPWEADAYWAAHPEPPKDPWEGREMPAEVADFWAGWERQQHGKKRRG